MGRFFDCQLAIASWGTVAKFKRAKVGLIRKGSKVFIAIFSNSNYNNQKFLVSSNSIELFPATIRFRDMAKDILISQVGDEDRFKIFMRELKVLLKGDKLACSDKAGKFDRFVKSIPLIDSIDPSELAVPKLRASIVRDATLVIDKQMYDQNLKQYLNSTQQQQLRINDDKDPESSMRYPQLRNRQLRMVEIRGLKCVPRELWDQTSLADLTLSDCNLTSIPKKLETLYDTLVSLDLSHNRIDCLRRTFCCKMTKLKSLNLCSNQIETLPIEIKFFRKLVDLNLSKNRLRMLPSTFSDLRSLRKLDVAENNLCQLPAFRKADIRLQYLDVSHNPLDGALSEMNTFVVHPPEYDNIDYYYENYVCPMTQMSKNKFSSLYEISMLKIVRCDRLLKLASEASLPRTIVSAMQRDVFKCYKCSLMNLLPAYNSTDILDYVDQVEEMRTTGNYRHGMTFMKLLCRGCFENMSS